jgi:Clp amino terminal domain, pathogenicity island component
MSRPRYSEPQLLRIATRRGDPDAGLTAVAELRRRLEVWEAAHVDEAVSAGWSWRQIAESLGVTRQAAHARHAKRRDQGGLVVAGRARRVVRRAREEATRMGAESLETDHLLLGLLLEPEDGPVKQALDGCGITVDAVRARAQPLSPADDGQAEVSAAVRETLEHSMREAVARGDARLDVEHLLLAILHEPGGRGRGAVIEAGQSPGAVERRLGRALRAQSEAPSSASSGS